MRGSASAGDPRVISASAVEPEQRLQGASARLIEGPDAHAPARPITEPSPRQLDRREILVIEPRCGSR